MRLRRTIIKMKTMNMNSFNCPKTGKLCVPLSGGAGYFLKLSPTEDQTQPPRFPWVAVWHHSYGCIGADMSISAGVKRANETHKNNIRRWCGEAPAYAL